MEQAILKKYKSGRIKEVWEELINSGSRVFEPEKWIETELVMAEIMNRISFNLTHIAQQLNSYSDFVFLNSQQPLSLVSSDASDDWIKKIEKDLNEYGNIPYSFKSFYKVIDSVDFTGFFVKDKKTLGVSDLDPLVVFSIRSIHQMVQSRLSKNDYTSFDLDSKEYYIPFSLDNLFKENISSSGFYGIRLSRIPSLDSQIVNFGINLLFINYMRLAIKWSGFPGLQWNIEKASPETQSFINLTKKGLMPF